MSWARLFISWSPHNFTKTEFWIFTNLLNQLFWILSFICLFNKGGWGLKVLKLFSSLRPSVIASVRQSTKKLVQQKFWKIYVNSTNHSSTIPIEKVCWNWLKDRRLEFLLHWLSGWPAYAKKKFLSSRRHLVQGLRSLEHWLLQKSNQFWYTCRTSWRNNYLDPLVKW